MFNCQLSALTRFILTGLLCGGVFSPGNLSAQEQEAAYSDQTAPGNTGTQPPTAPNKPAVTSPPLPGQPASPIDKRIFGVLPNYRTAQLTAVYQPISAKTKLRIAFKDSFDYPLAFLSAAYAGLYQLDDSHPQFGQGTVGYFKRLGTSYCDQVTGNFLTEGIMPIVFHEDPRYFRLGEGTKKKRTWYALTRIFVTKTDSGNTSFNFAEVIGNGMAAGIGLSYYEDSRDVPDYLQNWGTQLATDAVSQVLKEYWPDVKHWWKNRHANTTN